MTLVLLVVMSFIWLGTLVPAISIVLATIMLSDNGGVDQLKDNLVLMAILTSIAYYITVPVSLVVAWIAFFTHNHDWVHWVVWCPLVHIGVFAHFLIRAFRRQDTLDEQRSSP